MKKIFGKSPFEISDSITSFFFFFFKSLKTNSSTKKKKTLKQIETAVSEVKRMRSASESPRPAVANCNRPRGTARW